MLQTQVLNLNKLVMPVVQEGIEERVAQAKIDAELKAINVINTQLPEGRKSSLVVKGLVSYYSCSLQVVLN